jgi:hypothetical protein
MIANESKRPMLFRPFAEPLRPALQGPGAESLTALGGLNGFDQLEITCRHEVGLLRAYQSAFDGSEERREEFDVLCDALMEWLETEIAPLRFTRPN